MPYYSESSSISDTLCSLDTRKQVLFAALIVKNESRWLPGCLASLDGLVDGVVVCDTGSTDSTIEIASMAGATVTSFEWCDDFAAARNAAAEKARELGADWVISIDADERMTIKDPLMLRELTSRGTCDVFELPIFNLEGSAEAPRRPKANAFVPRLFKAGTVAWEGRLHEQLRRADGKDTRFSRLPTEVVSLDHYGYCVEFEEQKKIRNISIAEKMFEESKDQRSMFELARANVLSGNMEKARDLHRQVTEEAEPGSFLWVSSFSWLALDAHETRNHEDSLLFAESILSLDKGNKFARFSKGLALFHLARFPESVQFLNDLNDVSEGFMVIENAAIYSTLTRALARSSMDASSALRKCLLEDPFCEASQVALMECLAINPAFCAEALSSLDKKVTLSYLVALVAHDADLLAEFIWRHGSMNSAAFAWFNTNWQSIPSERVVLWAARAAVEGVNSAEILRQLLERTDPSDPSYALGVEVLKEISRELV